MTEPRAIAADFVTFRHVQGRKVLQLVVETPVEDMAKVFKVLGTPKTGESLWVAIAPMPKSAPAETSERSDAAHSSRKFSELPLVQQAGIRSQDGQFHDFLMEAYPSVAKVGRTVKTVVCELCGVNSRADIVHGEASGDKWHQIESQYQSWLTDRKFAEARR